MKFYKKFLVIPILLGSIFAFSSAKYTNTTNISSLNQQKYIIHLRVSI
ncbi:Uncharacterised protein (plasmid) [Mycoplasmopsis gallopavonis]|uniref:Uncharacterized protein n=1 Tax=Mycoplasmopsis gallopavonis TaxID=76629 RepID=A0A449B0G3_9BACT|nr:Uncharacterised protein [Mycoplasmopsis gallopavonis]